ncbi:MAG: sulfite reductase subunit A [Candidatus Brocadia sp. AMX2]|uniref:4Fe-4S dicluster domain-containing protein n=1 Tax=Candidatus Brocadia sp. AMX2 TaxID=2293635 RepID=UPI0007919D1C|nr:4Fe-4S dicluster domain-containing protein [Candidatus Brocadia sp. AMX2]KXK25678.1 MAG: 4Fe-4S ferredoxin iron-sulfur binding protein [Candidatus Brocadia sinica]MBC6932680.1 sulfite reductase subunit A [Candidatus Brocadia sp.]MBL1169572.1 sulfite reductase subunit A [Candidatus Brocadia sp. AMX1]NOG42996.1 4Fe-4S dicluster domain-containing protein [Planctomycetota bacterium]KAA0243889.1 MAG: sulfite reductase subunit A [Candidatus Brocadia sp. AMX2]
MIEPPSENRDQFVLEQDHFQKLLDALIQKGYRIVGPTVGEGAIVYNELNSIADLPVGWTDEQDGGTYRLKKRDDQALFGYVAGPHSWKKFLLPSVLRLWQAKRVGNSFQIIAENENTRKFAFIGVRSCDMHAIAIQDKVFMNGQYVDPHYQSRRTDAFILAVNCGKAGGTCFCVSMNTGPKATFGFDLAMTEILEGDRHYFVIETGTELGAEILHAVPYRKANEEEISSADSVIKKTAGQMGRSMDTRDIKDLLYRNYEHPRWDTVAERCLTCANCTLVCPTCFCTTVEDVTDLTGEHAERWRKLDSCFTMDFSYIHGGSVRSSTKARYRQWMTHKIATWIDQFGTSGCVGCGRCITWCPVAIDITEEARAIRENEPILKRETTEGTEKKTLPS